MKEFDPSIRQERNNAALILLIGGVHRATRNGWMVREIADAYPRKSAVRPMLLEAMCQSSVNPNVGGDTHRGISG